MKRKIYITITAVLLIIALAVPAAFAMQDAKVKKAPGARLENKVTLTDAQKSELKQINDKMVELDKQKVQKYIDFGIMTQEQGDAKLKNIDEMQKRMDESGVTPGLGKGGFSVHSKGGRKGNFKNSTTKQEPNTTN